MNAFKLYAEVSERVVRILRDERKRRKLSKYAMEQRVGISQQMVGYVERGERRPSLETALKMAAALDLDLGDVIKQAQKFASKRNS